MLLSGVFVTQIAIDSYYTPNVCHLQKCKCLPMRRLNNDSSESIRNLEEMPRKSFAVRQQSSFLVILENKVVKFFAFLLQVAGIYGFSALTLCSKLLGNQNSMSYRTIVGYPVFCIVQSMLWSNVFQDLIAKPRSRENGNYQAVLSSDETGEDSEEGQEDNTHLQCDHSKSEDHATARFKSSTYLRVLRWPTTAIQIQHF